MGRTCFVVLVGLFVFASAESLVLRGAEPPIVTLGISPMRNEKLEDGTWYHASFFERELARQAVLMAARDQLGLATRDAALREPFPANDRSVPLELKVANIQAKHLEYELTHKDMALLAGQFPYNYSATHSAAAKIAAQCEAATNEIAESLRKIEEIKLLDTESAAKVPKPQGELPADVEKFLRQQDLLSQYLAVRLAHRHMREHGSSLEVLSALARSYAHLSQLSSLHLTNERFTYAARALLYASRMVREFPESPQGYWHQAYVFTWIGLTKDSMWQLERAKELIAKSEGREIAPPPDWMPIIELANDFDYLGLANGIEKYPQYTDIVAFLCFRAVETGGSDYAVIEIGKQTSRAAPGNIRVLQGMDRVAGVAYRHRTTVMSFALLGRVLQERLPDLRRHDEVLDRSLANKARDIMSLIGRQNIVDQLRDVAASDVAEPSVAVLGDLINATDMASIAQRVHFLTFNLGTSAEGFLDEVKPVSATHPLGPFLDTYRYRKDEADFSRALAEVTLDEPNFLTVYFHFLRRLPGETKLKNQTVYECSSLAYDAAPTFDLDYAQKIDVGTREAAVKMARWMVDTNPKSPKRIEALLRLDWDNSQDDIERWVAKYGHHPGVIGALADQYFVHGDLKQAEAMYEKYVELAPDYTPYRRLATLRYRRGGRDLAIETVEKFLTIEDYGLNHAQMQNRMARTLMAEGDYEAALPWAQDAAKSYSAWGLETLAECQERLGNLDEALKVLQACDDNYQSHIAYYFVARTGHGDLESEYKKAREHYVKRYGGDDPMMLTKDGYYALVAGKYDVATKKLEDAAKQVKDGESWWLFAAYAAHLDGKPEVRDRLLGSLSEIVQGEAWQSNLFGQLYTEVARSVRSKQAPTIPFDLSQLDTESNLFLTCHLFLGWSYEVSGDKEKAIEHYTLAANGDRRPYLQPVLAWKQLVALGVDPTKMKFRYETF